MTTSGRTLRRDARRNVEKLTAAARELFAERGVDVPLEEIARRAGVSIGTLYNRFRDRYALIDEVLFERMTASLEIGATALAQEDPWEALVGYLQGICALQARDRGVVDALSRRFPRTPRLDAACAEGFAQAEELIGRARRGGGLRTDFTVADLVSLLWANARIVEVTGAVAPDAWRRHVHMMIDGLRAEAARPVPVAAMETEQIDRARRAAGAGAEAGTRGGNRG